MWPAGAIQGECEQQHLCLKTQAFLQQKHDSCNACTAYVFHVVSEVGDESTPILSKLSLTLSSPSGVKKRRESEGTTRPILYLM